MCSSYRFLLTWILFMPKTIADPNAVTISLTLSSRSATFLCSVFMPVLVFYWCKETPWPRQLFNWSLAYSFQRISIIIMVWHRQVSFWSRSWELHPYPQAGEERWSGPGMDFSNLKAHSQGLTSPNYYFFLNGSWTED